MHGESDYPPVTDSPRGGNTTLSVNTSVACTNEYCVPDEDYIEMIEAYIFPSTYEWLLIACHVTVFLVGLVGNALVCISVYRNHSMRTVTNYFIVNLAVADFLVILFCLPPSVLWDVTETWFFGSLMCKLVLYLQVAEPCSLCLLTPLILFSERVSVSIGADADIHLDRPLVRHLPPASLQEHVEPRQEGHRGDLGNLSDHRAARRPRHGHGGQLGAARADALLHRLHLHLGQPLHAPLPAAHRIFSLLRSLRLHAFLLLPHRQGALEQEHSGQRGSQLQADQESRGAKQRERGHQPDIGHHPYPLLLIIGGGVADPEPQEGGQDDHLGGCAIRALLHASPPYQHTQIYNWITPNAAYNSSITDFPLVMLCKQCCKSYHIQLHEW